MNISWIFQTVLLSSSWTLLMIFYSPIADKVATKFVKTPPNLQVFRGLQKSREKLILGILIAWALGAFLEEWVLRGLILERLAQALGTMLPTALAVFTAIIATAVIAGIIHLYQGLRAAIIIAQLSVLFGVLFVISNYNLPSVILCHGLYDTFAFVRFAQKKSMYSNLDT